MHITMLRSIMTLIEFNSVWFAVKLFPARSNAVMLNNTSPCALFSSTGRHACICHCTIYIHHVCRVQDCNDANITILGSTYVMDVNGTVANASVIVDENSAQGDVLFNITAFDLAGNNFTANQTELNSSNVIIDNASPMLDNLTIYSNNANASLATVNNILNITITANETLKDANITILNSTYVMDVNGTVANASVIVDENSAQGEVLFNITAI